MARKKITEKQIDEAFDSAIDEAVGAQDSLKPNSAPVADADSKVEAMARVVGMATAMSKEDLNAFWKQALNQWAKLRGEGPGDSGSNQGTQDTHLGASPHISMPMQPAGVTVQNITKEDVDSLLGGIELTEEDQAKVSTLFEAAVSLRVSLVEADLQEAFEAKVTELEEQYESDLTEAVAQYIDETSKNLDAYVEYAVESWMADNEVGIVDTLRLENAETFMSKLKDLFVESYIDVPEERLDVVREMSEQVVDLEDALAEAVTEVADLRAQLAKAEQEDTFDAVAEGLTLADAEKFKTLIESVEFVDADSYAKKLKVVKENYFPAAREKIVADVNVLNEDTSGFVEKKVIYADPLVEAAARILKGQN